MKKFSILFGIIFLVILLLMSGCSKSLDELRDENDKLNNVITDMTEEIDKITDKAEALVTDADENWRLLQECIDEKKDDGEETIINAAEENVDVSSWTLLDSSSYDITGDGDSDAINIYTSAIKDDAGNMMWDDGQYFLVSVNDGENVFILFNERVQIGRVFYSVFKGDESGVFVTVSTYAGMWVKKFTYSEPDGHFIVRAVFDTGDINIIHSTMPWD